MYPGAQKHNLKTSYVIFLSEICEPLIPQEALDSISVGLSQPSLCLKPYLWNIDGFLRRDPEPMGKPSPDVNKLRNNGDLHHL